jgi:hypothetical protein
MKVAPGIKPEGHCAGGRARLCGGIAGAYPARGISISVSLAGPRPLIVEEDERVVVLTRNSSAPTSGRGALASIRARQSCQSYS